MSLILFEDEHLLVVNKPAGWNTHAPDPYAGEGIYDWLKHREPRWHRLAIIHRLDKETSGVMVFGKTGEANRSLTEQFASRMVRKKYLLLTDRKMPSTSFTATSAIARAGEKYVSRPLTSEANRAETRFTVQTAHANSTVIEAEPVTGRTHQIRVHAAEHGFPILGDALYGGTKAQRVFLHALELTLKHPVTGERLTWSVPPDWSEEGALITGGEKKPAFIDAQQTNAFRLIHGASQDWPGFYVDRLGEYLLAQSENKLSEAQEVQLRHLAHAHQSLGVYHKLLSRDVRQTKIIDASARLVFGTAASEKFLITENTLTFEMSFAEGYSVGLFLDQRDNRRRFLTNHVAADFPLFAKGGAGTEVLNTFAYTCGFSVAAAQAGARTTSLDLSKKYLEWGKRNFALNQIDASAHDFIYGDAFDWMRRFAKKGRAFDAIILDPPTFSQSKESGVWQAEKHYGQLAEMAVPLLKRGGVLFASTNAAKWAPEDFVNIIRSTVSRAGRQISQQHYVPQPPDFPISRAERSYLKTIWVRIN